MKTSTLTAIVAGTVLSLSGLAHAHSAGDVKDKKDVESMAGMESMHSGDKDSAAENGNQEHVTTGTIAAVNTSGGRITIAHEPVPTLKWPAMKMAFRVADAALLDGLSVGDKIRFVFIQDDAGKYVVQDIRKQ